MPARPPEGNPQQHPLIDVRDAVVVRAGKSILEVVSFVLGRGESVAILGPNGAGKSTFIKLVTREVFPLHRDSPPVRYCGASALPLEDLRKRIGVVSATMQDQMSVHLTALEVVCGGLFGSLGVPRHRHADDSTVACALGAMGMMGVGDLAGRDVLTLSTGQARRVLFARALVNEPELLVLDEPSAGLDPAGMHQVRHSMRAIAQSGTSIMLVTQHPEDVIPEIQRVVLLKGGRVVADGPKEELLRSETMSELYDAPLQIACSDGYYALVSKY